MAMTAHLYIDSSMISIDLYPGENREWVSDLPDDRAWPFDFDFDAGKLEAGEHDLGAIRVGDVSLISDYWLQQLDTLALPRVNIVEAGMRDASISDVFRWIRQTYPSRYATPIS